MFRRSRVKIVASIMGILALLFAGTLCVIYFSSYVEVFQKDRKMLSRYAEAYWIHGNPKDLKGLVPEKKPDGDYLLRTFYSVAISEDGEVISLDNDMETEITDDYLVELSQILIKSGKTDGIRGEWVYHIEENQGMVLVVLMDNTIMSANVRILFQYTTVFGGIAMVLLFLVSIYLSGRIVRPLEESYRKQKQFISDASHELKTPIAAVNTNVELLERECGQNRWLDNIRVENQRMGELVHQLLELARAENTKTPMNRLDFSRLVTGCVLSMECVAFENGRNLESQIQDAVFVMGNTERLERLVTILLENALEYAPIQTTISVELKAEKNKAMLSVTNEGEAIPKEQRQNLFDRFYRMDESRDGNGSHYGLGLAIAKGIVTAHNGKIEVSCEKNQVTFSVSLSISS